MSAAKPYTTDPAELGFDPDELREKYNFERDKRIRKEGFGQYKAAVGELEEWHQYHRNLPKGE